MYVLMSSICWTMLKQWPKLAATAATHEWDGKNGMYCIWQGKTVLDFKVTCIYYITWHDNIRSDVVQSSTSNSICEQQALYLRWRLSDRSRISPPRDESVVSATGRDDAFIPWGWSSHTRESITEALQWVGGGGRETSECYETRSSRDKTQVTALVCLSDMTWRASAFRETRYWYPHWRGHTRTGEAIPTQERQYQHGRGHIRTG